MIYQTTLAINTKNNRIHLIHNFGTELSKYKTEFKTEPDDLALLCNIKNPIEENDKEAIFYVYGTKTEEIKKYLKDFGFKIIYNIPEKKFYISGKKGVSVK